MRHDEQGTEGTVGANGGLFGAHSARPTPRPKMELHRESRLRKAKTLPGQTRPGNVASRATHGWF
eukprot:CAMPEP_0194763642 /NCGR_PEP_ID=MMETSP0323_2-20130528/20124_1 /TAXON_ID=2866 ORGANISM="Crypthecodinium cohnii, Strain Seligo" /NCGR_SAMPLE_ID=MMETSP0323_2 /ASSEMBLY_ACC=CAM_ASM_000346 /LENGTH=64 /DNA_ID=CAMNT_0039688883 /DNA_START=150 /DNA_END=341 /DNA_ORIENTATION=-